MLVLFETSAGYAVFKVCILPFALPSSCLFFAAAGREKIATNPEFVRRLRVTGESSENVSCVPLLTPLTVTHRSF